jgi:hypothetical protein
MCRFVFYMGPEVSLADLVTRPENSLINQSVRSRERPEPLNGDGFGLAWYVDGHDVPARFRSLTPAWSNANLDELARVTTSRCILAHVRAATSGSFEVAEANCHPFRRGRYSFMHNGHIPAFRRIRRPLMARLSDENFLAIRGTTDTEHVFALIAEFLPGPGEESYMCAARVGVDAGGAGTARAHRRAGPRHQPMIGASALAMRSPCGGRDQAAENLGEARLLHARDDVLPAVGLEQGGLQRHGLGHGHRAAADLHEVAGIRLRLGLQDAVHGADQGDQVVHRPVTRLRVQPRVLAPPLELVEHRVLRLLPPVVQEHVLVQFRQTRRPARCSGGSGPG